MKISTDMIRAAVPEARMLCVPREFDYVDIVDYSTKPKVDPQGNILWCVTRSESVEDLSWYGVKFDRMDKIVHQFERSPSAVVLTDRGLDRENAREAQQIVVPDVKLALERIHCAVLKEQQPTVIGVTGSVGKTTCGCMIEDLFSRYAKTLRLYSKRITPLNLFEMTINGLNGHKYVVMEYAMYHQSHVGELVRLMPPAAGAILNIESAHLGVDGLNTKYDIWNGKKALIEAAQQTSGFGFVEREVKEAIGLNGSSGFNYFSWKRTLKKCGDREPFIRSELQYKQMAATLCMFRALRGQESEEDIMALCDFVPREKRLMKVDGTRFGKVFFDGEVTNASRMKALSLTFYPKKTLIIRDLEFYEQDLEFQIVEFAEALQRFDCVYVHRDAARKYQQLFPPSSHARVGVFSWLSEVHDTIGELFVHWGAYWRQYESLDELFGEIG